ncbi:MAG: TlpA family protein disulfide reductase [Gemmatimonadetes bacterium]|nr:TlpA family protein disulfide reductase [Gemmatimonadota bacterium]
MTRLIRSNAGMKPTNPARSPYFWAIIAGVTLVLVAWMGRASYRPVITGSAGPAFTAFTLDGESVSLAAYSDKVVLVNIWATWCLPCREEMPSMQRLYEALKASGEADDFEILAVSIDAAMGQEDSAGRPGGDLQAFADEYGLTFPILHDPSGDIQRTYQTTGVPESFVIGKDGLIYKKVAGPTEWDLPVNQELVRRLLGG